MLAMPAFAASIDGLSPHHMTTVVRADAKAGRLVRSVLFTAPLLDGREIDTMIDRIAAEHGVESPLVHSMIRAESNYNPVAVSPKGAQGMMQLIPATATRFGVSNPFDVQENIQGGVRYLRFLLDYYQGDYPKTIAAYNAGEGAVDKYHGIPPYAETRNYVDQVARNLKTAREIRVKANTKVAADMQAGANRSTIETSRPIQTSIGTDGMVYYRTP